MTPIFATALALGALVGASAFAQTPPAAQKTDAPPAAAAQKTREHAMGGLVAYYSHRLHG